MPVDRSGSWGNLAIFFALLTLGAACANTRAGWRAETVKEIGAAFATTGGPLLAVGAALTGLSALRAHKLGSGEARRAALAGVLVVLATAVHASLAVAALTRDDPSDERKPFELIVTKG